MTKNVITLHLPKFHIPGKKKRLFHSTFLYCNWLIDKCISQNRFYVPSFCMERRAPIKKGYIHSFYYIFLYHKINWWKMFGVVLQYFCLIKIIDWILPVELFGIEGDKMDNVVVYLLAWKWNGIWIIGIFFYAILTDWLTDWEPNTAESMKMRTISRRTNIFSCDNG